MNSPLVSIIIPMYKVAPYIERCLKSLANQDIPFEHYEIICVNDGSPDNCSELVRQFQNEIPNIILLDQENQGVSMARNNALAIAKGKYMLPIDPDDYLVPNCLNSVLEQAETHNLDILYAAFEIFDVNQKSIWRTNYSELEDMVDNGPDGYFAVRGIKIKDPDRSWALLYRMDLIKKFNVKYPKDVPFLEDGLFLGKVFSVANRVGYSNKDFYQRTTRMGSATNSKLLFSKKAIDGFLLAVTDLIEFHKTIPNHSNQIGLINQVMAKFVFLPLTASLAAYKFLDFFKVAAMLKNLGLGKLNLDGCRTVYLDYGKAYNKSPLYFICIYYLKKMKSMFTLHKITNILGFKS